MVELTSTRSNPMIDPTLHVWGWEIPTYLFVGGLVAGMMIIAGFLLLTGRHRHHQCACFVLPALGLGLLTLGMAALFLDLEHPLYVWRLYTTFEPTSPMSWGSWILLLVYPALAANLFLRLPRPLSRRIPRFAARGRALARHRPTVQAIGILNIGLGILLGIYTGVLLSSLGARPFWNSALLGPLFLCSGLSAAAAFVHLVARDPSERALMARADNLLLATELALVLLFVVGLATSARAHQAAAALVLGGPYTAVFWVLVVGGGIVIPLFIQTLAVSGRIRHTPVAPILVLLGGIALRAVVVAAGQATRWPAT